MTGRFRAGPLLSRVVGNATMAFLLLPLLAIIPASFSAQSFLQLPPTGYSTRWYTAFAADPGWIGSLATSLQVALLAASLATVLGTLASLGVQRLGDRMRVVVTALVLSPMIVPAILIAIGLYYVTQRLGLYGTITGMALSHALLGLPLVVLNVGVSLNRLDPALATAATGLGAGPWRVFRTVTLPLILPGVLGGAVFAFIASFDEVVIAVFLAGEGAKTLPVKLWEEIRVQVTPVATAASSLIVLLGVVLFLAVRLLPRRGEDGPAT